MQSAALDELGKRANSTSKTAASLAFVVNGGTCELIYRRGSPYCVSTDVVDDKIAIALIKASMSEIAC